MLFRFRATMLFGIVPLLSLAVPASVAAQNNIEPPNAELAFCPDFPDQNPSARDGFRATGYIGTVICGAEPAQGMENHPLSEHYTRWIVEPGELSSLDGQRIYSFEGRSWLARLFSDRVIETTHHLEIAMAAPAVSFTIPLSTFKYNEEGENGVEYTTRLRNHAFDQTYFRVNANSTANIVARAQHSFRTSFTGGADALGAVQSVISLVAPSSTLLTSVNSEQVTATSNAISGLIQSLFDTSYNETVEDGFRLDRWYANRRVLVVVQLPFEVTSHNRNQRRTYTDRNGRQRTRRESNDEPVFLSYWLSLDCPRASIFRPETLCQEPSGSGARPNTGTVLGFEMAANTTVQDHLGGLQWYRDFVASDNAKPGAANATAAARNTRNAALQSFCRTVAVEYYGEGFNANDVQSIVQAVIEGMPELARVSQDLTEECGGAAMYGLATLN